MANRRCQAGGDGAQGAAGADGAAGPRGVRGVPAEIVTLPLADVFGPRIPPVLIDLINYRD